MARTIKNSVLECFRHQKRWKRNDLIDKVRFLSRSRTSREKLDHQIRKSIKDLQEFYFPVKAPHLTIVHTIGLEKDEEMIYKITSDAKEIDEYCEYLRRMYIVPIEIKIAVMRKCGYRTAEQQTIDLNRDFGH